MNQQQHMMARHQQLMPQHLMGACDAVGMKSAPRPVGVPQHPQMILIPTGDGRPVFRPMSSQLQHVPQLQPMQQQIQNQQRPPPPEYGQQRLMVAQGQPQNQVMSG
jgi:hypothetical protein